MRLGTSDPTLQAIDGSMNGWRVWQLEPVLNLAASIDQAAVLKNKLQNKTHLNVLERRLRHEMRAHKGRLAPSATGASYTKGARAHAMTQLAYLLYECELKIHVQIYLDLWFVRYVYSAYYRLCAYAHLGSYRQSEQGPSIRPLLWVTATILTNTQSSARYMSFE